MSYNVQEWPQWLHSFYFLAYVRPVPGRWVLQVHGNEQSRAGRLAGRCYPALPIYRRSSLVGMVQTRMRRRCQRCSLQTTAVCLLMWRLQQLWAHKVSVITFLIFFIKDDLWSSQTNVVIIRKKIFCKCLINIPSSTQASVSQDSGAIQIIYSGRSRPTSKLFAESTYSDGR